MNSYKWKINLYPTVKAQDAGERIDALIKEHGGQVTPKQVVDASRPEQEVLHPCFEWDDCKAAEKYREKQAAKVLQNITVISVEQTVIRQEIEIIEEQADVNVKPSGSVRAYTNVKPNDNAARVYMNTVEVLSDSELRAQALNTVKTDIKNFLTKYEGLNELVNILEELIKELREENKGQEA